jgi:hypothetical protein
MRRRCPEDLPQGGQRFNRQDPAKRQVTMPYCRVERGLIARM